MKQVINKSDFINDLSLKYDRFTETTVNDGVREILDLMIETLVNDGRVEVRGFGSFSLHHRKARMGRNPKTGENIPVSARAIPHFKPGKALKESVNDSVSHA